MVNSTTTTATHRFSTQTNQFVCFQLYLKDLAIQYDISKKDGAGQVVREFLDSENIDFREYDNNYINTTRAPRRAYQKMSGMLTRPKITSSNGPFHK